MLKELDPARKAFILPRTFLVFAFVYALVFADTCKFLTTGLWVACIVSLIAAFLVRKEWASRMVVVLFILWLAFFYLPVDVCFKHGPALEVRWVRVVAAHYTPIETIKARLRNDGLIENVDYVIYSSSNISFFPKRAVLVVLPLK